MLHLFIIPLFPIFGLENALSMTPYFTVQQSKYGRKTQNNKMVGPNENNWFCFPSFVLVLSFVHALRDRFTGDTGCI